MKSHLFFFFSSRRRHTRFKCDWSSDVCSSDLAVVEGPNSFAAKGTLSGMVACPPNGVDAFAQFNASKTVYKDFVQSFSTVEPAIDLSASSFLAFSWQMAGAPSGTP